MSHRSNEKNKASSVLKILSLAVVSLLTLASVPSVTGTTTQNDAGSGSDAPDSILGALLLEPGTYDARLAPPEDDTDWYRIAVPSGHGLTVRVLSDHDPCVDVYTEELERVAYNYCRMGWNGVIEVEAVAREAGELFIRIRDDVAGNYTFHLSVGPLPDFVISAEEVEIEGASQTRTFHVSVTNQGLGSSAGHFYARVYGTNLPYLPYPASGLDSDYAFCSVPVLESDATWNATVTTSAVGDVRVYFHVWTDAPDLDHSSNFWAGWSQGTVPMSGVGEPVPDSTACHSE